MSTLALHPRVAAGGAFNRVFHALGEVFAGIREARAIAARYETLSRLSNTELARRGLQRSDIPQAAVRGII